MDTSVKAGRRRGPTPVPAEIRFSAKCKHLSNGCVEWIGAINSTGYGTFYAGPNKYMMAHRWSYEHALGAIPDGLHLDHLCRNTRCVNPEHLEPVTARENLLRGKTITSSNAAKTHCPQGHEYTKENTYTGGKSWARHCRTCTRARHSRGLRTQRKA